MTGEQTVLLFVGPLLALSVGLAIYGFAMAEQRRYARADREQAPSSESR